MGPMSAFLTDVLLSGVAEEATRLLAGVAESSDDAIFVRSLDGTVLAWNAGAARMLGYTATEMVGGSIAPVWREDRERFEQMQLRLAAGRRVPPFDARAVRSDGRVIDVSVSASPLASPDGLVADVAVTFRDVTERRAAEADARRLAALVAGSDDAIMAGTIDGTVTSWNPGAERLYGYSAKEMIGSSIARIRQGGNLDDVRGIQAALMRGQRVAAYETREVRKDGSLVDVSVSLSPIHDADGEVVGVSSIARDISERKRAEREAADARLRFEKAFAGAPVGMAIVSPRGRFLEVNASLCRLLGRDQAELLATTFERVTHPDDLEANRTLHEQALSGEIDSYQMEKRYLRPGGEAVWASLSVSVVRDAQGDPLYLISQVEDISARREAEEELIRYSEHLSELALRDPLTGLRNFRDFHALLDTELERSLRYRSEWSVVLIDIDGLRAINSASGHREGDRVLRELAAVIREASRDADLAARIGSDEFALILHETDAEGAQRTAERIAAEAASRGVSVSCGAASWPADGTSKELVLLRADLRLRSQAPSAAAERVRSERPDGAVQRVLELAREQLGMDVTYLSEIGEERQVFRALAGDSESFGVETGGEVPLEATYCARMLRQEIPGAVPDTALQPQLKALPITDEAGVGAYLGVPVELPDGGLYGTLCAVSHDPKPELSDDHLRLLRFLADLVVETVLRGRQEAFERRAQAELAGIDALLAALLARDHYTGEHSQTVVGLGTAVARQLGLSEEQIVEVDEVALLHDIGKVGIPDAVLQKRAPLNEREWELMRQHPAIGARILAGTETLSHLAPAIRAEHERYDGAGYPDGLRGEDIPLASRITFACDAYHAMTSDRPYRAALPEPEAREELRRGAGSQFDPDVVEALLAVLDAGVPRQVSSWEPDADAEAGMPGDARAVCRVCGTHTAGLVTQTWMSASCSNCGSYELDLIET
jgi:diguanylate cyclase (GGDEF)-like protein/PAS domain S-box-containing protein